METIADSGVTKRCTACKQYLPVSLFHHTKKCKRDGRVAVCKMCCKQKSATERSQRLTYKARYREEHRAELAKKERERRLARLDHVRAQARLYAAAHREESRARSRRWRAEHPERVREVRRKHKLLRRSGMTEETALYAQVVASDPCSYCGDPIGGTVDHIAALNAGGTNLWDNLTGACYRCNQSKRDVPMLVWLARRRGEPWQERSYTQEAS